MDVTSNAVKNSRIAGILESHRIQELSDSQLEEFLDTEMKLPTALSQDIRAEE